MRNWLAAGLLFLATQSVASPAPDIPDCAPDGLGVGGYDLVSYRSAEGPVRGVSTYTATISGLRYYFVSAANRDAFLADTERFLPVYRGWCAATLSFGKLACPDYQNFKIENDRLLLFEHTGFTNGRTLWNSSPKEHRERADRFYSLLNR